MNDTKSTVMSPTYSQPFVIICATIYVFIIAVSLLGNTLVFLAICVNKRLRSTPTMTFICSLACSDLLTTVLAMPFDAESLIHREQWRHSEALCVVWTSVYLFSVPVSLLTLLALTIDRYKSLSDPLRRYRKSSFLSVGRAELVVAALWCYCLAFSLLPVMGWKYNPSYIMSGKCIFNITPTYSALSTILHFILPLLIIAAAYFKIYRIAQDVKKCQALTNDSSPFPDHLSRHPTTRDHRVYRRNLKATKTVALVVCALFICWLPHSAASFFFVLCKFCYFTVPQELMVVFLILGYLNSALNPFIYSLRHRKFKDAYHGLFLSVRRLSRISFNRSADASRQTTISERRHVSVMSLQTSSVQLTAFSISSEFH